MQAAGRGVIPAPPGVVYHTSMTRPDAALALAALYALNDKREARVGAVCIGGAGLDAAIFADVVGRFYVPGGNSNSRLPVGLAVTTPMAPNPAMVRPAIDRKRESGQPQYNRVIQTVTDTSLAEAVLRNGVTLNAEGVMVLSAPATWLARSLDLQGAKALYADRVRRLVIVNPDAREADPVALGKLLAEWPSPVVFVGAEVGRALKFPGARLDALYQWAPAHPVADAYRAFAAMPYDEALYDIAAVHYAVKPEAGLFEVSAPGAVTIGADGRLTFAPGASGRVRQLTVAPANAAKTLEALIAIATAAPTPPPARGRGAA